MLIVSCTVIENISKKRQPLPELDSIYFITPELSSVESLCQDFSNEKQPKYKSVHLFFTTLVRKLLFHVSSSVEVIAFNYVFCTA